MSHHLASIRLLALASLAAAAALLASCKAQSCDPEPVDRAEAFLEAHQSCETDADCVVVTDFCGTLPNGYCGQLVMNQQGKSSSEWADISDVLKDCSPEECTVCLAARVPACNDGRCGGP